METPRSPFSGLAPWGEDGEGEGEGESDGWDGTVWKKPHSLEDATFLGNAPMGCYHKGIGELHQPAFWIFIILLIVVSSICLALDVPRLDPESQLKYVLNEMNLWMTGFFILEMMLKIISYGFACNGDKSYILQAWNILDFCIVMISILGLLANLVPAFGKLKSLRILRVLRPLRLLNRIQSMKLIITSLVKTLPACVEVTAVVLVFHVVFSIVGMMLFSDQWGSCTIEDFENAVKLVYDLPHLHHSGGTVCEPVDVPVNKRHLDMVYAHIKYSDKPYMGSVTAAEPM